MSHKRSDKVREHNNLPYHQRPDVKARKSARDKARRQRPDVKAKKKANSQRPDVIARTKAYHQRPDVKAKKKAYNQRPDVIDRTKARTKAYSQRPDVIDRTKAYSQRPDVKARSSKNNRRWREDNSEYLKAYNQRPDVIDRTKARTKAYSQRPDVIKRQQELSQRPEYKQKKREYRNRPDVKTRTKKYRADNAQHLSELNKKWRADHAEEIKKKSVYYNKISNPKRLKRFRDRRLLVLNHYSTKSYPICAKCGEKKSEFLQVDHILGVKKQESVRGASNLINYLLKNDYPDGYQILCGNCNWLKEFELKKRDYSNNLDAVRYRKYYRELKVEVFTHYSTGKPKCNCCGLENINALSIDHIKGRKQFSHGRDFAGPQLNAWIKRNNYPKGFQILCVMCNNAKSGLSKCPHQK